MDSTWNVAQGFSGMKKKEGWGLEKDPEKRHSVESFWKIWASEEYMKWDEWMKRSKRDKEKKSDTYVFDNNLFCW